MKKMKAARSKLRTDMTASINRQASKCVPTRVRQRRSKAQKNMV